MFKLRISKIAIYTWNNRRNKNNVSLSCLIFATKIVIELNLDKIIMFSGFPIERRPGLGKISKYSNPVINHHWAILRFERRGFDF